MTQSSYSRKAEIAHDTTLCDESAAEHMACVVVKALGGWDMTSVFSVRLLVMQHMVLLSKFSPSIRLSDTCIVTKLNDGLRIFWYHTIRQSLYSDTNSVWWAMPLPSEICTQTDPPSSKNADFDRFLLIMSQS